MYKIVHHVSKFDFSDHTDLKQFEDIKNDPMCTVVAKRFHKLKEMEYNDDGKLQSSTERIECIVEWTEKTLF